MQLLHAFSFLVKTVKRSLLFFMLLFAGSLHSQLTDSAGINSLYVAGWKFLYTNPDSASWFFEEGKKQSGNSKYVRGLLTYYNYDAALSISLGQNQKALENYDHLIAIAKTSNLVTELGLAYMKKGTLSQFMGESARAAESYLAATSVFKTNEDKKKVIGLYNNIISTLNNLQQQNQSLQNVLPALKNNNINEKEIVAILSQKKTNETVLDFPDQTTLRDLTGGELYVIFGGAKFPLATYDILGTYSNYRSVRKIPDGMLSMIPDIPREGTILREANDKIGRVWVVKDKQRHHVESPEVLDFFGGWDALCTVPEHTLAQVPDAGDTVTMGNVLTTFNFRKEHEVLVDTLQAALLQNTWLLAEVGKKLKNKNNVLQRRKTLLWTSLTGTAAILCIGLLLVRNARQKQNLHRQTILALKTKEELQQKMALEKERTRIASDMHDDLGAGLTRIKFIAEDISEKTGDIALRKEMEKLKVSSIELVENMSEIIWAMNEKNNTLEDLLFYLRSYSVDYCNENNLACQFILPEDIPQKTIGGQVRRNIFLVLKESLHNIVKHAGAKKVIIDLQVKQKIVLTIADDGSGFQPASPQQGNGLLNMEQRAGSLHGKLWISHVDGTAVHLEVPL